jgi:hypothetical protein
MLKKLSALCLGMVTIGAIGALAFEDSKQQQALPESAVSTVPAQFRQTKLTGSHLAPFRMPEGGYTVPVTFSPTQEQFTECTILDLNEDNAKWEYYSDQFRYKYGSYNAGDDWCILPKVHMDGGSYKITYSYKVQSASYEENFSIWIGNDATPEAMTTNICTKEGCTTTTYTTESTSLDLEEGDYYIGLYAYSPANAFYIFIKDISIEKLDTNLPKMPTISDVSFDGYECTMTVTAPSANLAGEALDVSTVHIKTSLESPDSAAVDNGEFDVAPGAAKTFSFNVGKSGAVSIFAKATINVDGSELSSEAARYDASGITKKQPVPTPMGYIFAPDQDEFVWCTVVNANNDGKTWEYANSGYGTAENVYEEGAFRYSYAWSKDADDWLILPAFDGSTEGAHQLVFNVGTKYGYENLDVYVAYEPTVEAMTAGDHIMELKNYQFPTGFETKKARFAIDGTSDYYIGFHCTSTSADGTYLYLQKVYCDLSDGSSPLPGTLSDADFDGGDGTITVNFPSKDYNNEDLTSTVYAELTLDGETYGEPVAGEPGEVKQVEFSDLELGNHSVTAAFYTLDGENKLYSDSKASISFKVTLPSSFAYELPLELALNNSVFDYFVVVDANEDGKTWVANDTSIYYSYSTTEAADDWFFTPAINIADVYTLFDFTLTGKTASDTYPENFSVYIGKDKTIEAMTTPIIEETSIKNTSATTFSSTFQLDEAGRYYIGVHCTSAKNMWALYLSQLTLKESVITMDSPAAIDDLEGDGLETGELKAQVNFTFPSKNMKGDDLAADLDLTAHVTAAAASEDAEAATVEVTGKPGQTGTATLACPEGTSEVEVYVTSADGQSPVSRVTVKAGLDKPSAPVITSIECSEDNASATITYNAVTTGQNGGHCNPAGMDYYLWEYDEEDEDYYQCGDPTSELSLTYSLDNPNSYQDIYYLAVQAYNGQNSGSSRTSCSVVLGKPETLPMSEDFAEECIHYSPLTFATTYNPDYIPSWDIVKPSTVQEDLTAPSGDYILYGHTTLSGGDTYMALPKFSTVNAESAEVDFTLYSDPYIPQMTVYASAYGQEEVTVGTFEIPTTTEGWKTFTFELPESLLDKSWVCLRLYSNFVGGSSTKLLLDSYEIRSSQRSAVESLAGKASQTSVVGLVGAIRFNGCADQVASVFTPAGVQAAKATINADSQLVRVPAGIYIVTVGSTTAKVIVR